MADDMAEHAGSQTQTRRSLTARCAEVMKLYGPFGLIAFGGPAANIVMLRKVSIFLLSGYLYLIISIVVDLRC